jgi:hypothetical protein
MDRTLTPAFRAFGGTTPLPTQFNLHFLFLKLQLHGFNLPRAANAQKHRVMFLQFVVHAHAKSLPTTASKANPKLPPGRAQRSVVRREAIVANSNLPADNLKTRPSPMFQLNAAAFGSHEIPGISHSIDGRKIYKPSFSDKK